MHRKILHKTRKLWIEKQRNIIDIPNNYNLKNLCKNWCKKFIQESHFLITILNKVLQIDYMTKVLSRYPQIGRTQMLNFHQIFH